MIIIIIMNIIVSNPNLDSTLLRFEPLMHEVVKWIWTTLKGPVPNHKKVRRWRNTQHFHTALSLIIKWNNQTTWLSNHDVGISALSDYQRTW